MRKYQTKARDKYSFKKIDLQQVKKNCGVMHISPYVSF